MNSQVQIATIENIETFLARATSSVQWVAENGSGFNNPKRISKQIESMLFP